MGVFAIAVGVDLSFAPQSVPWVVGSASCLCRDRDFSQRVRELISGQDAQGRSSNLHGVCI